MRQSGGYVLNSIDVKMPRLGTNDNYATIGQWNVENGSFVKKGTLIAVVETTKETQEIEAEADGYIRFLYSEGDDVLAGTVMAKICDSQISVELGEGNLVFAGAVVGSCAKIGNNCIINTGAIVSHDCAIGNHVKISPGAVLGGSVSVGDNSLIGMGGYGVFWSQDW